MKKVLLTMVSLVASVIFGGGNLKAQETTTVSDGVRSAEIVKSADGKKLVVAANGDLKDLKCANGEKEFTESAVNNVYVDANGTKTSVNSGDKYSASATYYQASRDYTEYTIASENKVEKNVFSFTQKAFDAPLYVYSNNHNDWANVYKEITKGDTPYHAGGYTMSYSNDDNINTSWNNFSFFYVENGDNYQNLSTEELLQEEYVTQSRQPVLQGLGNNVYMSTDGGQTYTLVLNGDVFNENATYYTGGETKYSELSNVDSYVSDVIVPFSEYLPELMEGVTSATFTSVDKNNPSMIDNPIVWALLNTQVRILDLSGVKIDAIVTPFDDQNMGSISSNKGTFTLGNPNDLWVENNYLETLYTPQTNAGGELKWNVFGFLTKLRYLHLSEGIETLGLNALIKNEIKLSALTFPNSLKYIKKGACADHFQDKFVLNKVYNEETGKYDDKEEPWIQTLVFPAGLLEIESGAFGSTCPKDVYFLGVDAPKVAKDAWGDNSYICNNSMNMSGEITEGTTGATLQVKASDGIATRTMYNTQNGWLTMLHYPRECTEAQAAKYTDITRKYSRVDYDFTNSTIGVYAPGKEESDLKGTTQATSGVALKQFENMYSQGEYYGGNYSGGYYDAYTGEQYLWPSMGMAYRATVAAQNDVLWDGVTTIGDGIRNQGGDYSGDGSEYIGLHQFVLAKGDAESKSTPKEFPMDKYADGEWHTICLPFNITKGQMKEIFGKAEDDVNGEYNNIRLCKFNNVIRKNDGEKAYLKLCFNQEMFHDDALSDNDVVLQAHVSYMIKAKKENAVEGQKVVMTGYEMQPGNPIPTCIIADEKGGKTMAEDDEHSYRFIGTYLPNIKMPQYTYFFSKSYKRFRFQGGTTGKWNPYTCVVEAPLGIDDDTLYFGGAGVENPAKMFTGLGELSDDVTGVEKVTIEAGDDVVYTNGNVYNLNGQLVSKNGTNGLAKGIYVVNGKKVLVK